LFTTNITAGTLVNAHNTQPLVAISENTTDTNSAFVLTPKGTGGFILGPKPDGTTTGGNARGANAVDLTFTRSAAAQVASGSGSFQVCQNTQASGINSIAIGSNCQATGTSSVSIGGNSSFANTSSAQNAISYGFTALADRVGMHAHAHGRFNASGDAQRARFVLRCKTTTNSAVEMAIDGATTYLGIPSGKVIACTINISGVKSDGSAVAHYIRQYAVKNVGGTSSQVYAPVTIGTDNAAGTSIALSANNTDDTLRIAVTGIASETWRWVAAVDAVEIGYGT
jgi:hypothetical protein